MQASMTRAATWRSERKERCWNSGASAATATTTSSNANLGDDEKKSEKSHSFIPSTWSVYTVASLLLCIGFFNLLLNLVIIVVLRISQGMEALQVVPAERLLKFYGNTDLDHVSWIAESKFYGGLVWNLREPAFFLKQILECVKRWFDIGTIM